MWTILLNALTSVVLPLVLPVIKDLIQRLLDRLKVNEAAQALLKKKNPQTFEEFEDVWPAVVDGIAQTPLVVGGRAVNNKKQARAAAVLKRKAVMRAVWNRLCADSKKELTQTADVGYSELLAAAREE